MLAYYSSIIIKNKAESNFSPSYVLPQSRSLKKRIKTQLKEGFKKQKSDKEMTSRDTLKKKKIPKTLSPLLCSPR